MAFISPTTGALSMTQLANSFNISSVTNLTLSSFRSLGNVGAPATGVVKMGALRGRVLANAGLMFKIANGYHGGNASYFNSAHIIAAGNVPNVTTQPLQTAFGGVYALPSGAPYSVQFTGFFYAPNVETYKFYIGGNDQASVSVNGAVIGNNANVSQYVNTGFTALTALTGGNCYSLQIMYGKDNTGDGYFESAFAEFYGANWTQGQLNFKCPNYIPVANLVGWYDVGSWTGSQWTDKSGGGNHAVLMSGIVSATGDTLSGTPDDGLLWPAAILPATYTLFYVARYNDPGYGSRGRIFNGYSTNWLSGFWNSFTGVAYHSDATGWVTDPYNNVGANNEWIVGCDRNTSLRCNGKVLGSVGAGNSDRLCINARPDGGNGEYSDWAVSEVIVYNRALSLTEILQVEAYLFAKNAVRLMYDFDLMSSTARAAVTCVFSMRHVRLRHSGPMFQVRRASDNEVVDVYASRTGAHGLSFGGTGTSLASWAAGATMYVTTWYNQAGVDFEWSATATQYDEELQPLYDAAKGCINFRTNRWFSLDDGTVPSYNQAYTVIAKHGAIDATHGAILSSGPELLTNRSNTFRRSSTSYVNYWWSNDYIAGTYAANNRVVWTYNESGRQMYVNGTPTTFTAASGRDSGTTDNFIGRDAVNSQSFNYLNGDLYYLHIFSAGLNATDHSLLTSY